MNITLKIERTALKAFLNGLSDPSVIGSEYDGWTIFSSQALELQDQTLIDRYGAGLSGKVAGPVMSALNHDDDILGLGVFQDGAQLASYNSCPGYFLETASEADMVPKIVHPEIFDALAPGGGAAVSEVLRAPSAFACETHAKIAQLIGLPREAARFGFKYAERGELDALDLTWCGGAQNRGS